MAAGRPKVADPNRPVCPQCGPGHVVRNGPQYRCQKCRRVWQMEGKSRGDRSTFSRAGNALEVEAVVPRIMTDRDLLDFLKVDRRIWRIDRVIYGKSEAYRKDRLVHWDVRNGRVLSGHVQDSGELKIRPLFSVKVFLSRRTAEIEAGQRLQDFLRQAKAFAPKYRRIRYPRAAGGLMYEIEMPDLHLGQLAWAEESGKDADVRSTMQAAIRAAEALLAYVRGMKLARIWLPIGNDFFNVNDARETTIHDTRQQEDTRPQKTFRLGELLVRDIIDRCSGLAPVDVIVVPGNHDEERIFYLGEYLEAWYHRNPNVTVDNRARKRKYKLFGANLIGFTHGYYEKVEQLGALMPGEEPQLWAKSAHREFHMGHLHKKRDRDLKTDELDNGVVVRILRSLAVPSTWMFDKAYVGAARAAEGFLWHPANGLCGQFTSPPT